MMGFDGNYVTPQIKKLIEDYKIGSILLTAKNLKSKLINERFSALKPLTHRS